MKKINYRISILVALVTLMCSIQCTSTRPIHTQNINAKAFELREGVIADPGHNLMYIMNTGGGIDAVELGKGTIVWRSSQAAKPLMVVKNLLFCQGDSRDLQNELRIVVLDVQNQGRYVYSDSIKLPEIVQVSIDETINNSFKTRSKAFRGDIYVFWEYSFQEIEGITPLDTIPDLPLTASGIVQINPVSQTILSLKENEVPTDIFRLPPDIAETERIRNIIGIQFRSADDNHVLSSKLIADDRTWDKYHWTVYDRSNGNSIASVRNYLPYTPFFVLDNKMFYETGPYYRQGIGDEPLKIRSMDIKTGKELWSLEIRDTVYRGPFPP